MRKVKKLGASKGVGAAAAVFLAPAFLFLLVFIVYSVIDVCRLSLFDWNGIDPEKQFVGFANWNELFHDSYFWGAALHNLFIVVFSLVVQMPIAMGLAFMLDRLGRKSGILKVIYYLPSLFSTTAVGLLFLFIYSPYNGIFTTISQLFGGGVVDMLGDPNRSLIGVFSVICWTAIPFYMVFYLAALSGLSQEVYEVSIIDGANLRQYFFRIALPMLKGAIKTAFTLSIIGSLKYFDLVFIMTEGGPNGSSELMATYMYRQTFRSRRMGYGAALAVGMFVIITIFALVFQYLVNRSDKEEG